MVATWKIWWLGGNYAVLCQTNKIERSNWFCNLIKSMKYQISTDQIILFSQKKESMHLFTYMCSCVWRTWMVRILHLSLCQFKNTKLVVIIHSVEEQQPLRKINKRCAFEKYCLFYNFSVIQQNHSFAQVHPACPLRNCHWICESNNSVMIL